jgi:endonuclease/exonuclease/phosphatase family metal-dependent hydrolase
VRVLTWNLFHGRSIPNAGRGLASEFAELLASWEWDVALLQEVPPWWPDGLARAAGAQQRHVLTSRNLGLPVRRAVAARNPDLLKANGGGCNAILVRGREVYEHRTQRLTWRPEPRWAHGVRLSGGLWAVNLHGTRGGTPQTWADARRAAAAGEQWAAGAPLVLGGDLNLRGVPELPGLDHMAGNFVDHIYTAGLQPRGRPEVLERGALSDHAPVRIELEA